MRLPRNLTTVTSFSKIVALGLFIALPFIGFYCGRVYQKSIDQYLYTQTQPAVVDNKSGEVLPVEVVSWKEFKDPSGKYSFNFPEHWLISFEQSPYYKDRMDITVQGPEGKVDVLWADSYGGACQDPGYEKTQIKSGEETICHAENITGEDIPQNSEFWQLQRPFKPNKSEGIYLNAYSFNQNRDIILEIIKSLDINVK